MVQTKRVVKLPRFRASSPDREAHDNVFGSSNRLEGLCGKELAERFPELRRRYVKEVWATVYPRDAATRLPVTLRTDESGYMYTVDEDGKDIDVCLGMVGKYAKKGGYKAGDTAYVGIEYTEYAELNWFGS